MFRMKTRHIVLLIIPLMAFTASAQRHKSVRQHEKETTEQTDRLQRMIQATQRIVFIDSIVIEKKDLLRAYHLSAEAGRLTPYSTLFPTSKSKSVAFINALNSYCCFSQPDKTALFYHERLLHQWSKMEEVPGINDESQFQRIDYPFMMPDGVTLYFAAEGKGSIGGYDIFMTSYDVGEGRFLKPENIGMPFNSTANDYLFAIDEYNQLGFFASDRNQPDNMVCVYTFIPVEKYQTYDTTQYTPDQIEDFARISDIKQTWNDEQQINEARIRLQQVMTPQRKELPAFSFVINDQLTYHQLKDFKVAENQGRYRYLTQLRQRYEDIGKALEKARNYYPKASTDERTDLSREIMDNEQVWQELYHAICQQEKVIRNSENIYLTKNN